MVLYSSPGCHTVNFKVSNEEPNTEVKGQMIMKKKRLQL